MMEGPAAAVGSAVKELETVLSEEERAEERCEVAMNSLAELVTTYGPIPLLRGMPSYQAYEAMVACIERLARRSNALESLVALCDGGPDLSQSGEDPEALTIAREALKEDE